MPNSPIFFIEKLLILVSRKHTSYFCVAVLKNLAHNKSFMELRYTEPHIDHRIAEVGRDFQRSLVQLPRSAQDQLEQVDQGSAFEHPQGWRLCNLFGQPVAVLDHPPGKKNFPHIQLECLLLKRVTIDFVLLLHASEKKEWKSIK